MPNFLISVAPSARKKIFLGLLCLGKISVAVYWCGSAVALWIQERWGCYGKALPEHVSQYRPPRSGSCPAHPWIAVTVCRFVSMEILFSGNICLTIHVPSLKFDGNKRIFLSVSYLDLQNKQNAVSKEGSTKPEFWCWRNTSWLLHNFFANSPWPFLFILEKNSKNNTKLWKHILQSLYEYHYLEAKLMTMQTRGDRD